MHGLVSPAVLVQYLLRAVVALIAIPFHESAHALVSLWLGDDTAVRQGRLSLNPLRHFDPLGVLCMVVGGVGWAKPVSVSAWRYKNPKLGMALSAAAGPAANLLLAFVSVVLYKALWYGTGGALPAPAGDFFYYMVAMNTTLAVFNLLPVPPFDGSRIALLFLPREMYFKVMRYEKYIMLAVLALVFFGVLDGPLSYCVNAVWGWLFDATGFVDRAFLAAAGTGV